MARIAEAGIHVAFHIHDRQVAEVNRLLDPPTLDADEWGGQVRHSAEYKEGSSNSLWTQSEGTQQ